jgi:acetoin utilization protein AcuB
MIASDVMTKRPATIRETASIGQAADLLQTLEVRHLPVIGDDGRLAGMLSDRDVRTVDPEARVADLMSTDVISVESESEIEEIVELMLEHKVGAVPVVDGDGSLVGIVSYMDVLREARFD